MNIGSSVEMMHTTRFLCSVVHSMRSSVGIPVIQPLSLLEFYRGEEYFDYFITRESDTIADECNIETIEHELTFEEDFKWLGVTREYRLKFKEAGKIYGKDTQFIGKRLMTGDFVYHDGVFEIDDFYVPEDLVEYRAIIDNESNLRHKGFVVRNIGHSSFLVLHTQITPELADKRLIQEAIKLINAERRARGFSVGDKIGLELSITLQHPLLVGRGLSKVSEATKTVPGRLVINPVPGDEVTVVDMWLEN